MYSPRVEEDVQDRFVYDDRYPHSRDRDVEPVFVDAGVRWYKSTTVGSGAGGVVVRKLGGGYEVGEGWLQAEKRWETWIVFWMKVSRPMTSS